MKLQDHFPIDKFTSRSDSILRGLPSNVRKSIEQLMIDKNYKKGQNIFLEGSFPAGIFYLREGLVKKYKTDHVGKEHILYLCSAGELMGYSALLCNETYPDSASALEPSSLGFIPKDAFLKILSESGDLWMGILSSLSHEFGVLVNSVTVFAHMSVRERLALILLILAEKFKKTDHTAYIEIRLSREDLANMVGTAVETLVRLLQELKKEGIVQIAGRTIIILKSRELVKISKFY
jgi:CRP-like cAMP-binding protein